MERRRISGAGQEEFNTHGSLKVATKDLISLGGGEEGGGVGEGWEVGGGVGGGGRGGRWGEG